MAVPPLSDAVSELANAFSGELLQPTDSGYEEARKVHNGLIDKRPALIARCSGTADVVDAVNLARERGLQVSVRGGGHNVAGRAVVDDGLMIDLSVMKGIHVDPKGKTVRAQGGVTWGEFDRETLLHGLATTGGIITSTGIAGLTLGGGIGWLMGKHGLVSDNLLSVDLVAADGRLLSASEEERFRSLLGATRRRRKLWRRYIARVSAASGRGCDDGWAGRPHSRRRSRPPEILP